MNAKGYLQTRESLKAQAAIFNVGNLIQNQTLPIGDILDYIPGSVMIQDLSTLTNTYMNKQGCDILRHSREELQELGPAYFDLFFPKEEIAVLKTELHQFIQQQDHTKVYSFFQQVRPDAKTDYKWYLTSTRLYPGAGGLVNSELMHIAIEVSNTHYAARKINDLVGQQAYIEKNYARYNLLTRREKEIIRLITDGYSTYSISDILFISQHTVNCHRKNIIAKLQVKSLSELIRFAMAFQLFSS
jgi:LuxR family transcriptional regulator